MTVTIVFVLLCLLLLLHIPVAFSILLAAAVGLWMVAGSGVLSGILETTPVSATAAYEFVTVPMFLLMAEFVIISGIADGIFRAAAAWVGRLPGGLAIATALAGAGFGAISGSSTASAATLSATSVPAMLRENYEPRLAYGVVAISGTLAMLIPPSVAMILYGLIADVSIAAMFIGGVIPGIIVGLTIILTVLVIIWFHPDKAPPIRHYTRVERAQALKVAAPMVLLFMAVTGVIYTGVATPTEASAIGALGAFCIALGSGRLTLTNIFAAAFSAARTTCMILMVIMAAHVLTYFIVLTGVTDSLIAGINALEMPRWGVLLIVYAIFLVLGCFLDLAAILVLTIPIVLPLMTSLGYDPIWFGIMVIIIGEVGLVTPPVGLNVFVVARVTHQPVAEVFRGVTPHVFAHLVAIAVLTIFPELVLWLPNTMR